MKKHILSLASAEGEIVVFNPEQASMIRGGGNSQTDTTDTSGEEDEEPMD